MATPARSYHEFAEVTEQAPGSNTRVYHEFAEALEQKPKAPVRNYHQFSEAIEGVKPPARMYHQFAEVLLIEIPSGDWHLDAASWTSAPDVTGWFPT